VTESEHRRRINDAHDYSHNLGSYTRKVTTTSADTQRWFDRGLNWCFGYHHEEAVACFEKALKREPNCAMARWGIAYAVGPNYNFPWELQDPAGRVIRKAVAEAAPGADPVLGSAASARAPQPLTTAFRNALAVDGAALVDLDGTFQKYKGAGRKFIDQGRHRHGARHCDGRGQRRPAPARMAFLEEKGCVSWDMSAAPRRSGREYYGNEPK
jgi:hypothetical protein